MPRYRANVCIDLNWLDGHILFPGHIPGQLKVVCHGSRIERRDVVCAEIVSCQACHDVNVLFEDVELSDTPREAAKPPAKKLVDEMGQYIPKQWTGIEFLSECRGWPVRISQAGMPDLCGDEKSLFALRKALWTTEPTVRIAVCEAGAEHRRWMQQFVWSGEKGKLMEVNCYTNAGKVELFLNGQSLGAKEIGDHDGCVASWEVPYQPGELRAVIDGAEDVLSTTGKAEVTLYNGEDCIADTHDECIFYQVQGDAEILDFENGKPDDLPPYAETFRSTFHGRALVYLRAGRMADDIILRACTRTGLKAECRLA